MSIIKLLSDNLINQIAAGEVVDRPSSVVKELMENSIDSKSSTIIVDVKDGGLSLIKIKDDGFGMTEDDLLMSVKRHATSKISKEEDLWNIFSLGFRGEALASISSVSRLTLRSKKDKVLSGSELNIEGGNLVSKTDTAMQVGTEIIVRDLFFNTPARKKFLKKESTEFSNISFTFVSIALSHLDISFKLIHNGKVIYDLVKTDDLTLRIADIFGKTTSELLIPIYYGAKDLKISGFIAKPSLSRSSQKHQYFFVNGRYIKHIGLSGVIKQAYKTLLMEHKNPVFFIKIDIDPSKIDVNVHPRKLEVRFSEQQSIIRLMYSLVKNALDKGDLMPKGFSESKRYMSDSFPSFLPSSSTYSQNRNVDVQTAINFTKHISQENNNLFNEFENNFESNNDNLDTQMRAISQLSNSYIVAQKDSELILIDQHAGHERVRYEELMDQFESQKKEIQILLLPHTIDLSNEEFILVEENLKIFTDLGFDISPFGGKTFLINAVPRFLSNEDINDTFLGVIDDILNNKTPNKFQGKTEEIITYMSCRSAIKFGQKLNIDEMQSLIDQMSKLKRPYTCPHGRPTMVSLTMTELEKMFGRK